MSFPPIFPTGQLTASDVPPFGPAFDVLWPPEETPGFDRLLGAIDQAVVDDLCRSRMARLHRMLERNYPV